VKGARTGFVNLEELSDEELERLQEEFAKLQKNARHEDRPSAQLKEYKDVVEAAEDAKAAEKNTG
jgi:hypothetical protein